MADIWVLSDGKLGHLNQSLGLAEALLRAKPQLSLRVISLSEGARILWQPDRPRLIISAGRRTHLWSWLCKLRYRARNVVLMRPSLPYLCFDLALVPEHDKPQSNRRVVATLGVVNRIVPSSKKEDSGLVLMGGPSKHFGWDEPRLMEELRQLRLRFPQLSLTLADSRRTPDSFRRALVAFCQEQSVSFKPVSQTGSEEMGQLIADTEIIWVSADSASMVYESLTSGAAVGVLMPGAGRDTRVSRSVEQLIKRGLVSEGSEVKPSISLKPLAEADRCASEVIERGLL